MKRGPAWIIGVCVAESLVGIAMALHLWGAVEVRTDWNAVFGLTLLGAIWIFVALHIFSWLGLSHQYDVAEARNPSAVVATSGALIGVAILYACGNFGEGPSYRENFFSAGLGTVAWLLLWFLLEAGAAVSVSITEERDLASGLRMGGWFLAGALVLGRATAGNWESVAATIRDFIHDGWPAAALLVIALPIERFARPSRARPFPSWFSSGALPALFYLAVAGGWLWHLGPWEGMP